jgi:hypothetical protein
MAWNSLLLAIKGVNTQTKSSTTCLGEVLRALISEVVNNEASDSLEGAGFVAFGKSTVQFRLMADAGECTTE